MYQPAHFVEADPAALDALAAAHPFATLVTVADGAPFVSHVPVLYRRDADGIEVRGHWSRANPQWKHGGEATLILHGPHAYVSPSWYPDKAAQARVPTWNYAVAHLVGTLEILHDEADLAAIVGDLARRFEGERVAADATHVPWEFDIADAAERVQLKGIVGFRMRPAKLVQKFKLSQNHPVANQHAVIGQLSRGGESPRAVAALMRANLERAPDGVGAGQPPTPVPLPPGEDPGPR